MTRCLALFISVCLAALLLLAGCATPPPGSVPLEPMAAPTGLSNPDAGFTVRLWSNQASPRIGDFLHLQLSATDDAYLSLYAIHSSGRTSQLLDNVAVPGHQVLTFPGPRSPVDFRLSPPPGTETYLLIATRQSLHWLAPADIRQRGPLTELNLTGMELQQRLHQVLARQHPRSWNGAVLDLPVQP